MDEYFELLTEEGKPTGIKKERKAVHRDGDYHGAIHAWIINSSNEVLIQKRAPIKDCFPDLWDISVGGHTEFGETAVQAALRELKEELGLDFSKEELKYLYTFKQNLVTNGGTFINNEFIDVFVIEKDIHLEDTKLQEEEVSEVKYVPYEEMEEKVIKNDVSYVPTDYETHVKGVFDYIRDRKRRKGRK